MAGDRSTLYAKEGPASMIGKPGTLDLASPAAHIWKEIKEAFDLRYPNFVERIQIGRTTLHNSQLLVSLQIDRIAHARTVTEPDEAGICKMCKILRDEPGFWLEDYFLAFYDFPPFHYQFMVLPTEHRSKLCDHDLKTMVQLCRKLNCYGVFAQKGSGASNPDHIHFHFVPGALPFGAPKIEHLHSDEHVLVTLVEELSGGVTGVRLMWQQPSDLWRILAMLKSPQLSYPFNLILTPYAVFLIPRALESAKALGGLRLGAIEMAGLLCLRSEAQFIDYRADPTRFHAAFRQGQQEVCLPREEVKRIAHALIRQLGQL